MKGLYKLDSDHAASVPLPCFRKFYDPQISPRTIVIPRSKVFIELCRNYFVVHSRKKQAAACERLLFRDRH
jgi:hypothetical protein